MLTEVRGKHLSFPSYLNTQKFGNSVDVTQFGDFLLSILQIPCLNFPPAESLTGPLG